MSEALDPSHPNQPNPYPGLSNGVPEDDPMGLEHHENTNQNDQDIVERELMGMVGGLSGEGQDSIYGQGIYQDLPMSTSPPQQFQQQVQQQPPPQFSAVQQQQVGEMHTTPPLQQQPQNVQVLQHLQQLQQQQMNISPPIPAPSPAVAQPPQQAPTQPQPQPQSQEPAPPVPLSEYDQLLASLKEHPHSSENWNRLIDVAEQSKDMEKIKTAYESLLQIYPNTSAAQIAYLKHYTTKYDAASLKTAQTLFKPWLLNSASVDLLRFYVDYVRDIIRADPKTMRQCYDFAVNAVGHDKDAGEIWSEYIKFIHNGPTDGPPGAAEGAAQAATRINDLRKLYRRAVQIPLMNVEKLWQDYVRFETETSKQTVKDMLQSQLSSYTTAKLKLKELRDHLGPLYPTLTAAPGHRVPFNLPSPPTFIPGEKNLRDRWLHYLNWEESNPLMLEIQTKEGGKEFVSRLKGIYKNAVVKMRFYGEIWFRWFTWFNDLEKDKRLDKENPLDILIAGIEANPTSFLLNYALAEQYEIQQKYDEVNKTYNTFLEALQKELDEIEARLPPPSENGADDQPSSQGSDKSKPDGKEKDPERELFQRRIREMGSAWCMYMRFARRSQDQVASRKVFAQARKAKHLDWRVFDYAALTEYHLTKAANIATNIYESGLKRHPTDVEFICQYLQFLININDESNARSLFERVITNPILTPEKARPIWEKWSTYEFNFGDLAASQKMEKRMLEIYTVDPPTKRFAMRHKHLMDAIATKDRGFSLSENQQARAAAQGASRIDTSAPGGQGGSGQSAPQNQPPPHQQAPPPRRPSPELGRRRRDDSPPRRDYGPPPKRSRPMSPPGRDRWEGPPRRRGSPAYERDRERERDKYADEPPMRRMDRERDDSRDRGPAVPNIVSWFLGTLPNANAFDGPVFRTDDLIKVFTNANIPGSQGGGGGGGRPRSPPPPHRGRQTFERGRGGGRRY